MRNIDETSSNSIEFFQSKKTYSLAMVGILKSKGAAKTMSYLKEHSKSSKIKGFPKELTEKNLRDTIMNLNWKEVKFK